MLQKKKATTTLLSLPSVLCCSNTKRRQRQHALTFFAKLHPHNKKKGMTGSYRLPCYAAATEQEEGDDRVPSLFSLRYNKNKKKGARLATKLPTPSSLPYKPKKRRLLLLSWRYYKKKNKKGDNNIHSIATKEKKAKERKRQW